MPVVGKWNRSTWLTYATIGISCAGMYVAFVLSAFNYAHIFLMLAGICDMLDGFVARKCKRTAEEKHYGIELDSLADTISFVAFPAMIAFAMGAREIYEAAILAFFMLCGVVRLAFFNIHANSNGPVSHYRGLPVTFTALILPVAYVLISRFLPSDIAPIMYVCTMAIIGMLNILDFQVPKPKPKFYFVFILLAILMTVVLLV